MSDELGRTPQAFPLRYMVRYMRSNGWNEFDEFEFFDTEAEAFAFLKAKGFKRGSEYAGVFEVRRIA